MDPNYKSIEEEFKEVQNWTDAEKDFHRIHYYIDESDFVWAVHHGKVYLYNYETNSFIPSKQGIDIMKWHEFPESEIETRILKNRL